MVQPMSNIHRKADRFHAMLEKIQFKADDALYILGDVIDRGPEGISLLLEIMEMPNAVMPLVNHEYRMLQYMSSDATSTDIRRWNKNGFAPTLAGYLRLNAKEQQSILQYLQTMPSHLEVTANGQNFYLVHAWPGENIHDEVWHRSEIDDPNSKLGYQVIVEHTKVLSMINPEEAKISYAMEPEDMGAHLRILYTPGFINIDCGYGYDMPINALACIRLEDMVELYS